MPGLLRRSVQTSGSCDEDHSLSAMDIYCIGWRCGQIIIHGRAECSNHRGDLHLFVSNK